MAKLDLIYHSGDPGFCRIYYTDRATKKLFCFQENRPQWMKHQPEYDKEKYPHREGYELYRCTSDGEPSYPLSLDNIMMMDIAPESEEYSHNDSWKLNLWVDSIKK